VANWNQTGTPERRGRAEFAPATFPFVLGDISERKRSRHYSGLEQFGSLHSCGFGATWQEEEGQKRILFLTRKATKLLKTKERHANEPTQKGQTNWQRAPN
jgi:hypothetical protein